MVLRELDLSAVQRWVVVVRADLATHAGALDRLNVFPVADSDTGTNLWVTVRDSVRILAEHEPTDLAEAAAVLSRAMLTSARGNSGVILSQLVAGVAAVVQEQGGAPLDGDGIARALRQASDRAWASVARPVEGTILSVARAAADGAESASDRRLVAVVETAADAARDAVEQTTDQLRVLRQAGVVDAGGAGYLLVLEALLRVVRGRAGLADPDRLSAWLPGDNVQDAERDTARGVHPDPDGPAYEVMYLLDVDDPARVTGLKDALAKLGDSLVVAGGPDLWSVHVHTDDIAGALNAATAAGRPHQFSVTRFAEAPDHREPAPQGLRLTAVVSGAGLADLVRRRGGFAVPSSGVAATRLAGLLDGRAGVVLCDSGTAREAGERIVAGREDLVVAGRHPAHVVAALDVLDTEDAIATAAAQLADCERDMRLRDLDGSPEEVVERLAAELDDAELVTVVTGAQTSREDADRTVTLLTERHPELDIVLIEGGSTGAAYAMGVE